MYTLDQIIKLIKNDNQSEVARAVGVSRQYISSLVRGHQANPTLKVMKALDEYVDRPTNKKDEH